MFTITPQNTAVSGPHYHLTEEDLEQARPQYLAHEGWNHSVKRGAFVAKALLPGTQGPEVL